MNAQLRVGIVGWGTAGRLMGDAVARHSQFALAGVAEWSAHSRTAARELVGDAVYPDLAALIENAKPDAVYIATPTPSHGSLIAEAAAAGVAVVCEKPMASGWDEAVAANKAAEAAGVVLMVGNTHSYDAPIRKLRRLVQQGTLGHLLMVQSTVFTDWHARPRTAADLNAEQGGGVVLRQGAHHIDIARLICGGLASSISGATFGGQDGSEAGYSALLKFESGAQAGLHYSGAGGFDSAWLTQGIGELGTPARLPDSVSRQYFRVACTPSFAAPTFGLTVATFTEGQALLTSRGVVSYSSHGPQEHSVEGESSGWDAVLDELGAALSGKPVIHTGLWGLATLEASLALHRSSADGMPIPLAQQVPLPLGL